MAILCAEAAKDFIQYSNGEFEIIGPVMQNTDIFLIANDPPASISMVQNKHYQRDLIERRFGSEIKVVPLMVGAVPYALIRGDVEAAIVDYTKAMAAEHTGTIEKTSDGFDYDSFVLVANKEFTKTALYRDFVAQFNKASHQLLEDESLLYEQVLAYANIDINEKGWEEWRIKIVPIPER